MTVKERNDFTERMLFVLTSAVALKNSEQVRAATLALAEAHGMADYGRRVPGAIRVLAAPGVSGSV